MIYEAYMKIKINSKHPIYSIKLNYNCPESEKDGTGPGSCSDNKESNKFKSTAHIKEEIRPSGSKYYKIIDSNGNAIGGVPDRDGKGKLQAEKDLRRIIKKEENKYNKLKDEKSFSDQQKSELQIEKTLSAEKIESNISTSENITKIKNFNNYNFYGTDTEQNATLYNINNKKIVISDKVKNISADDINNILIKLPNGLLNNVESIEITNDKKSSQPKALGTYFNKSKTIVIYGLISTPKQLENTLYHEFGHQFDNHSSYGDEYKSAIKNDKKGFITSYAKNQSVPEKQFREDFADSFREFIKDEKSFSTKYPNRANVIRNKLNKIKQQK